MITLKQRYRSVKMFYKIVEGFKNINERKGNYALRYQQFFIERSTKALEDYIVDYNTSNDKTQAILDLSSINQDIAGYETLIAHGFKPWDKEVCALRDSAYTKAFKAIGDYVYKIVEKNGGLETIKLISLLNCDKQYLNKHLIGLDEKTLNEDIWLNLYAIKFLLENKNITDAKYLLVNLLSFLGLQEAYYVVKYDTNSCKKPEIIDRIRQMIKEDLSDIDKLIEIYELALNWAKLYQYRGDMYSVRGIIDNLEIRMKEEKPKELNVEVEHILWENHQEF